MRRSGYAVVLLAALVLLVPAGTASAVDVGVRGGLYFDPTDPFLGVELITGVANRIYFNPNFEWVFVDGGNVFTLNGDFHYDFRTSGRSFAWAGAGLALLRADPEGPGEGDTDLGLNLLAGIGLRKGGVIPYAQAKAIISGDTTFVLGVGVRF
jgi:hypothetical protein